MLSTALSRAILLPVSNTHKDLCNYHRQDTIMTNFIWRLFPSTMNNLRYGLGIKVGHVLYVTLVILLSIMCHILWVGLESYTLETALLVQGLIMANLITLIINLKRQ